MVKDRMLRVLFLPLMQWLPYRKCFSPGTGPDPFELHNHLLELGITTEIIDPGNHLWKPFARHGPLVESLDPLRGLRVALTKRKFDLIVSVFQGSAVPLLLLKSLTFFRTPIALWDIGLTENWLLGDRVLDYVVPRVQSIMVLGSNQKPYITRRWKLQASIEVIGHQVDTQFFSPIPYMGADGPILSVGNDAGRDFETLLNALDDVSTDVLIKSSQKLQIDKDRHPRVRLMSEWVSHLDLRALYARSRMVVVSLTGETSNASGVSTILEASAMGKALIVSDSEGIRDFIVPGETCLMVPPRNVQALQEAIKLLLRDSKLRGQLGQNARRFIEARFSIPVFAQNFGEALRRICSDFSVL
jgi:glycosyltransferase involved in cell wall biosynthesis